MAKNNIKLVNKDGTIVGVDPETGDEVPIELDETSITQASVGREYTSARSGQYVVHSDGSTIHVDGPDGSVVSGDWDTLATELPKVVDPLDCIVFAEHTFNPTQTVVFDVPVSLVSRGAELVTADDSFTYIFKSNVPQPTNDQYARKAVEISGFEADLQKGDGQQHGFYMAEGYLSNQSIYNNTIRHFDGEHVLRQNANSHVWSVYGNSLQDRGNSSGTRALVLYSGWSWIAMNDLGGGIISDSTGGTNMFTLNSIFNSNGGGATLSTDDIFDGNVVTDNGAHGVTVSAGDRDIIISNNQITNNSKNSDTPTYSGLQLESTSSDPLIGLSVEGNRIFNKYPLSGDHTGEQAYGINIDGYLENSVIDGSNVLYDNASGSINFNSSTLTNTRVEDPIASGRTAGSSRPSNPYNGMPFFDTSLGQPIWWDDSAGSWVDSTGTSV
ncbi:right-handed parallel beta-helix repeat-containing protein [Natrinema thermotolerans]|uniref:right-handed parallel beta-helix repeat-containing protein n=1 Tax=Natrinema thermotolerans TaxID=121872 RepID=UPI0006792242|nr:right-handed parallel beta-helix repeat-containing protein [Natrinema thermotolerans]QCC57371.1 right-handed parallel beta-helix repeat-containing protein [Natrinema thermotolerans]